MRAQQIWHWLYVRGATDFEQMTNVSKDLRARLPEHFTLARPEVVAEQISADGTRKWLLRLPGEHPGRESARRRMRLYPGDRPRHVVSLESGRLHAHVLVLPHRHAAAGPQPDAGEIVGQVMVARDKLGDWQAALDGTRLVSNIVMMGMGEAALQF